MEKLGKLGKLVTIITIMVISTFLNGYVFTKLWNWIITQVFDYQNITIIEGIGIVVLLSFMKTKYSKKDEDNDFWVRLRHKFGFVIFKCAFALFSGWIVTLFM